MRATTSDQFFGSGGELAFTSGLAGENVSASNDRAAWTFAQGALQLVAREGEPTPDLAAGELFSSLTNPLDLDAAGNVLMRSHLSGAGVNGGNDEALWLTEAGTPRLIAREGDQAPDLPAGVAFGDDSFIIAQINGQGVVAFSASVKGVGVGFDNRGIWVGQPDSPQLLAMEGRQAPGTGAGDLFENIAVAVRNVSPEGQVAFSSSLTGPSVDAANRFGLWAGNHDQLGIIARSGDPAPGVSPGLVFDGDFRAPIIADDGSVSFVGTLSGPEVSLSNREGIWHDPDGAGPGELELLARAGEQAPGIEPGAAFSSFGGPVPNENGQIMFTANTQGPLGTSNRRGLWAQDRTGTLRLIAIEGQMLEVAPGDFRTIDLPLAGRQPINSFGQVAFFARFTDRTQGVFISHVAAVPEPSSLLLLVAAAAQAFNRRRPLPAPHRN